MLIIALFSTTTNIASSKLSLFVSAGDECDCNECPVFTCDWFTNLNDQICDPYEYANQLECKYEFVWVGCYDGVCLPRTTCICNSESDYKWGCEQIAYAASSCYESPLSDYPYPMSGEPCVPDDYPYPDLFQSMSMDYIHVRL
jgi:hypothetical protein